MDGKQQKYKKLLSWRQNNDLIASDHFNRVSLSLSGYYCADYGADVCREQIMWKKHNSKEIMTYTVNAQKHTMTWKFYVENWVTFVSRL